MKEQTNACEANYRFVELCFQNGELVYPQGYAGRYIDNQGKLVICYVAGFEHQFLEAAELEEFSNVILYKECAYSYEQLCEAKYSILTELESKGYHISLCGLREEENKVVFFINSIGKKECLELENVFSVRYPFVSFYQSDGNNETYSGTVYDGMRLSNSSGNFSAGICGKYNNINVLLTCGHTNSVGTAVLDIASGTSIGTVMMQRYYHTGDGDFSIVALTTGWEASHKVKATNDGWFYLDAGCCISPATGMIVKKYSQANGAGYGVVTGLEDRIYYGTVGIDGLCSFSLSSGTVVPGDSGCPIVDGSGRALGIVSGGNATSGVYLFSPLRWAVEAGFTPYASHDYATWWDATINVHVGYCSICGAQIAQNHVDYWDYSNNCCSRCGHQGN